MEIKHLDWNSYHSYIDKLADKIKSSHKNITYNHIAGVDPDDTVVAVHLSHRLSIPVITDINLLSMLTSFTNNTVPILLVSNVVETGASFKEIMAESNCSFDTAALFVDSNAKFTPTYFVEIPKERIYFPWERCGINIQH
jgi:hypoxanthine phosphoribosyltransferase